MVDTHELFMHRCLDLAAKGLGQVAPNPMVGSIIVYDSNIIGEGYHQLFGQAHAEVNAVNSVPAELRHLLCMATLYVSLEPCSHHGKTPPCADMIIQHKIPKVVVASNDPNPQVAGMGIQKLREAGVEVTTGVLKGEADFLNRRFMTFFIEHRPWVILKWAESADGFMAPEEPRQLWLTNAYSKKLVHQWRAEEQAIMVGSRTIETDDPELTVRLVKGKNPARVILDRTISVPTSKKIFYPNAPVFVFNQLKQANEGLLYFEKIDFAGDVFKQLLHHLYMHNIQSIIIEGGPATIKHFIKKGIWDEARIFKAPQKIGRGKASPSISGNQVSVQNIQGDYLRTIYRQTVPNG